MDEKRTIKTTPKPCAICKLEWIAETFDTMVDGEVVCDDCIATKAVIRCAGCDYYFRPDELRNLASGWIKELYCDECCHPEDDTEW